MCSRLSFVTTSEKIWKDIGIQSEGLLRTSYNIAPTHHTYIIKNTTPDRLDYVTWGIIPQTAQIIKNEGKLALARAETLLTSTSFRIPARQKRCIVVVDSFYDLQEHFGPSQSTAKRYFSKNGKLLTLAGVWDSCNIDGYNHLSFSIITQQSEYFPNTRLPLILNESEQRKQWLSNLQINEIEDMLLTDQSSMLDSYNVNAAELLAFNDSFQMHLRID